MKPGERLRGWFGKSWGAPACVPNEHVPTPVGVPCARCLEPVLVGHQGCVSPLVSEDGRVGRVAYHLDCYLKMFRSHDGECPHCRGVQRREDHGEGCRYRSAGENCSCSLNPFVKGPS